MEISHAVVEASVFKYSLCMYVCMNTINHKEKKPFKEDCDF